MPALKPTVLKPGDTIGVVAPGEYSPNRRSEMAVGRELLEAQGFRVVFGEHVNERDGYLAGADQARADDFNRMWANSEVKAVLCWGTIWGAARILPYLNFDLIRSHPKLLLGCGNVTALHLAITRHTDLVTLYSPGFSTFYRSQYTFEAFLRALTTAAPYGDVGQTSEKQKVGAGSTPLVTYVSGKVTGTLVGGNLSAVAASLGTAYEIQTEGRILFLEARDRRPYTIERHLTALWLAGKLQAAAGIVIGECVNCVSASDETNTFSLEEVLENRLPSLAAPSLYGMRIGQGKETMPVPLGVEAALDADERTLQINEAALVEG